MRHGDIYNSIALPTGVLLAGAFFFPVPWCYLTGIPGCFQLGLLMLFSHAYASASGVAQWLWDCSQACPTWFRHALPMHIRLGIGFIGFGMLPIMGLREAMTAEDGALLHPLLVPAILLFEYLLYCLLQQGQREDS